MPYLLSCIARIIRLKTSYLNAIYLCTDTNFCGYHKPNLMLQHIFRLRFNIDRMVDYLRRFVFAEHRKYDANPTPV
jgi:hypothetical protein